MNKAILVLDMAEDSCRGCPIMFQDEYSDWCPWGGAKTDVYDYKHNGAKPDWCPLKPIPEKQYGRHNDNDWENGWNACIDHINKTNISRSGKNV